MSIVMDLFRKSPKKQEIIIRNMSNKIEANDPLVKRLHENLNIEQQDIFIQSFYGYLNCDKQRDYIISLDDVYEWIGYTRKQKAKELLEKHFERDVDYRLLLTQSGKQRGGHNKEQILMNKDFQKVMSES